MHNKSNSAELSEISEPEKKEMIEPEKKEMIAPEDDNVFSDSPLIEVPDELEEVDFFGFSPEDALPQEYEDSDSPGG